MKIVIFRGADGLPGVTAVGSGGHWVLINVSAAMAQQLSSADAVSSFSGLHEVQARAVVLTDAQIEHVGGLIGLRSGAPIELYATPAVFEDLTHGMPVLPVLNHYCGVQWRAVPVAGDRRLASFRVNGLPELEFTALASDARPPPYSAHRDNPVVGDSIVLALKDLATGQRAFFAPVGAHIGEQEMDWMRQADCLVVDPCTSLSPALKAQGVNWLRLLAQLPARHKVLLRQPKPAHATPGLAVAHDRMVIDL